ncbi:uncharacterized protein CTRU02_214131 [Colletotrichum truncatum]|uniref:Uncharacterized protein n=1 Tax=Colletotrichum truncatum TaxID=5467 RepID=A0ACC3YHP3_COLTU
MRRGGIEPPAPRRCLMATENFTTKPSAQVVAIVLNDRLVYLRQWHEYISILWLWAGVDAEG